MATLRDTNKKESKNSFGFGMCNPVIKKVAGEKVTAGYGEKISAYGGIIGKTVYLLLFCVAGIISFFAAHTAIIAATPAAKIIHATDFDNLTGIIELHTAPVELIIAFVAMIVSFVLPFVAFFIKSTIPVTGAMYAMCEGYFIGMIASMLTDNYKWIAILAFVITVAIVLTLLVLCAKGIVRVGKKARTFIFTFFIASIVSGIAMFGLSFVPALRPMIIAISSVMSNPIVSIAFSLIYLVIAILFLISDFEAIRECVENKLPKKYEWLCAFGLVYSIIYIYFKILNIILKIVASTKD